MPRCCRDDNNGSEFIFTASGILNWLQTSAVITATTPLRDPTLVTRRLASSPFRVSFYMIPCWSNMSLFLHIILHEPPTWGPRNYAANDGDTLKLHAHMRESTATSVGGHWLVMVSSWHPRAAWGLAWSYSRIPWLTLTSYTLTI